MAKGLTRWGPMNQNRMELEYEKPGPDPSPTPEPTPTQESIEPAVLSAPKKRRGRPSKKALPTED